MFKHNSDRKAIGLILKLRESPSYPVVTTDETWVHHVDPETKGNPSDCTILSLPGKENPKLLL
jgi:hypothetical protein